MRRPVLCKNCNNLFLEEHFSEHQAECLLRSSRYTEALNDHWSFVIAGVALWGIHMGITQGLLATMVANTVPADLRGTAFGFFNLVSGSAMLLASVLAGLLWDRYGATATFHAGAVFCIIALAGLMRPPSPPPTGTDEN